MDSSFVECPDRDGDTGRLGGQRTVLCRGVAGAGDTDIGVRSLGRSKIGNLPFPQAPASASVTCKKNQKN